MHLINSENLGVNIVTFGVLALGCKNKNEAKDLIKMIADHGFRYVCLSINIILILIFFIKFKRKFRNIGYNVGTSMLPFQFWLYNLHNEYGETRRN